MWAWRIVATPLRLGFTIWILDIRVLIFDAVHPSIPFLYRTIKIENLSSSTRNVRLFSNQNYMIMENKIGETSVIVC